MTQSNIGSQSTYQNGQQGSQSKQMNQQDNLRENTGDKHRSSQFGQEQDSSTRST